MNNPDYDIAILGLGPVGCMAAILFAHAGLRVVAFERDPEVYQLPRAVSLDGEIVRAFQGIGLGDRVNDLLQPVRPGDRAGFANSKREWMFGVEMRDFGSNGWQPGSMFDQPELESYLRDAAVGHVNVTAHIGATVSQFNDQGDLVSITAEDGDSKIFATARFLVGCDGAASFVRKTLQINWLDLGYNHDWLVVDITASEGNTLGNDTLQVCDPDRIVTYVCTKDPYRRWEFKLNPGETWDEMLDPEKIHSLIDPWTPRGTYTIRRSAVYQFHAATAERWRDGRVFIAGDAAHQTPPFLGQGMNAGMRDVINLAWKFPLVVSGIAKSSLLDSYQLERQTHANDLVDWAVSIGRLMEHLALVEAAERKGDPAPDKPSLKSSGYGQGREQPPIRDGVVLAEQVNQDSSTGFLFSQPIVRDGRGKEFKLDDYLGAGFAVVARTKDDLDLSAESHKSLARIGAHQVSLDNLVPIRGHLDRLFENHSVAIVRPDRYIFGTTTDALTPDMLVAELISRLDLTKQKGTE